MPPRNRLGIAWVDQQAGISNDLGHDDLPVGRQDRYAAGHRLQHGDCGNPSYSEGYTKPRAPLMSAGRAASGT